MPSQEYSSKNIQIHEEQDSSIYHRMSFTCVSCALQFEDVGGQRVHMKSDWHRYNLKRRVAQLPPIDEETFNSKISTLNSEDLHHTSDSKKQVTKKELRRKQKEALQQQKNDLMAIREAIQSKLTIQEPIKESLEVQDEDPKVLADTQTENSYLQPLEEEERFIEEKLANRVEIGITTCLFCPEQKNSSFETIEDNIDHMFKKHGLYLPETKYLIDKEGLIKYLGEKIGLGNVCLVCNYQGRNVLAVREHMSAKRHMKIPYETESEKLEISDFYDFSSTYDSDLIIDTDVNDEEDWEDVSGEDDDDSDEEDSVLPHSTIIYNTGSELVLPSGSVVGHRSLARYYRQNLPPDRILSEGQGTVIAAESRHFLNSRSKHDLAIQKRAWGREKKRDDINDRRAAKFINNQPHFRDPLLQ